MKPFATNYVGTIINEVFEHGYIDDHDKNTSHQNDVIKPEYVLVTMFPLENRIYVCPVPLIKTVFCLNPLYLETISKDEEGKETFQVHLSMGSVGSTISTYYDDLGEAVKKHNDIHGYYNPDMGYGNLYEVCSIVSKKDWQAKRDYRDKLLAMSNSH